LIDNLRILCAKLRLAGGQVSYLPRTAILVWQSAPLWTVAWACLLVAQGVLPVCVVYLTRPLVDGILAAGSSHGDWTRIRTVLPAAAAMAAVVLLTEVLRSVTGWVRTAQSELLQDKITDLIHQKSIEADLAFYESADYHDHLHRARSEAWFRSVVMIDCIGGLFQNGITLIAIAGVMISFGPWLTMGLVASTVPAAYVVVRYNLRLYHWRRSHTADERRASYYDWLLTSADNAAEVRLFGLGDHLKTRHRAVRRRLRDGHVQLARRHSLAELGAGVLALLITAAALGSVGWRALRGLITAGELALFYQAFQQAMRLAQASLENVGQLYANSLFLGNLFAFLALEPAIKDPDAPVTAPARAGHEVRFIDVTFRYPGSERMALDRFNLTIRAGQMVAIVGPNGAGKSTLLKLLCRFYDPEAGRIEIDGVDVRDWPLEELRRRITVLFQQPVRYNDTVAENISLGRLQPATVRLKPDTTDAGVVRRLQSATVRLTPDTTDAGVVRRLQSAAVRLTPDTTDAGTLGYMQAARVRLTPDTTDAAALSCAQAAAVRLTPDATDDRGCTIRLKPDIIDNPADVVRTEESDIREAADAAGAIEIIERLPNGYESVLGRSFADGSELSGGEWQRIALARAFVRQAPIVILDEPTSAMDPWAEADWLNRFRSISSRRTALLITHRFTTAMRADVIHVMSEGRIVESGTHEQLIARSGSYADSWKNQIESVSTIGRAGLEGALGRR
jgi:ATP-binding cassette, subfamily B, bacterial